MVHMGPRSHTSSISSLAAIRSNPRDHSGLTWGPAGCVRKRRVTAASSEEDPEHNPYGFRFVRADGRCIGIADPGVVERRSKFSAIGGPVGGQGAESGVAARPSGRGRHKQVLKQRVGFPRLRP